jgi:hypothetical protein
MARAVIRVNPFQTAHPRALGYCGGDRPYPRNSLVIARNQGLRLAHSSRDRADLANIVIDIFQALWLQPNNHRLRFQPFYGEFKVVAGRGTHPTQRLGNHQCGSQISIMFHRSCKGFRLLSMCCGPQSRSALDPFREELRGHSG